MAGDAAVSTLKNNLSVFPDIYRSLVGGDFLWVLCVKLPGFRRLYIQSATVDGLGSVVYQARDPFPPKFRHPARSTMCYLRSSVRSVIVEGIYIARALSTQDRRPCLVSLFLYDFHHHQIGKKLKILFPSSPFPPTIQNAHHVTHTVG